MATRTTAIVNLKGGVAKTTTAINMAAILAKHHAKSLCDTADALGCSIDYLLCRTDVKEMAQPTLEVSEPGTIWHPISEEPPIGVDLVWVDAAGYSDTGEYFGSERIESNCTIQWPEARYWAYLPKEEE